MESQNQNRRPATGKTSYGPNIAASIISLATKEINGVAALHGRGVRLDFDDTTINVDVYVKVFLGFSCSDVAFRVQENIKRGVETMTQYKVGIINVNVLAVVPKNEEIEGGLL